MHLKKMKKHTILLGIFFCLLNVSRIYGVHIYLHTELNTRGTYWTITGTLCNNLNDANGKPARPLLASFKTDTCMIVYTYADCQGYWSKKFLPTEAENFPAKWNIGSVRACNNEEGGPQLHVDLINYFPVHGVRTPATLHWYKNVCSCFNIPDYVQKLSKWSINNHNNEMMVYSEPNCLETTTSKPRRIPPGFDVESREMNQYAKARSFGPDPNSAYFRNNCLTKALTLQQQQSQQLKELSNKVDNLKRG